MDKLIAVERIKDIPAIYRNTPIELLFKYHNLGEPFQEYREAQILVGMCMDNRKQLTIPENFAFIIRTGGANLRYSEFKISFAVAIGGVSAMALIGHSHCGMVDLAARKEAFIKGLIEKGGWQKQEAEDHFNKYAPIYEIGNEMDFISTETTRLRLRYPKLLIAPLFYRVEDNRLYFLDHKGDK